VSSADEDLTTESTRGDWHQINFVLTFKSVLISAKLRRGDSDEIQIGLEAVVSTQQANLPTNACLQGNSTEKQSESSQQGGDVEVKLN